MVKKAFEEGRDIEKDACKDKIEYQNRLNY
jgi:hypothetical protein